MNHLIIHPGWGIAYGNQACIDERLKAYEEAYHDYCQKYVASTDTVVVFFPFLDNPDKAEILRQDLPLYLQGKLNRGGKTDPQILTLLLQHLYAQQPAQMRQKSSGKSNQQSKQTHQQMMSWLKQQLVQPESLIGQLVDLSRQQPLFYGCLLNHPATMKVAMMNFKKQKPISRI
jgi:hypothetical protein